VFVSRRAEQFPLKSTVGTGENDAAGAIAFHELGGDCQTRSQMPPGPTTRKEITISRRHAEQYR